MRIVSPAWQGCCKIAEKTNREETHEKTTFEFRARGADDRVAPAGHGAGGSHRGQRYLRCGGQRQQPDLDAGPRGRADDQRQRVYV